MTSLTTPTLTDNLTKRLATLEHVAKTASRDMLRAAIEALPASSRMLEHLMPMLHDEQSSYRPS